MLEKLNKLILNPPFEENLGRTSPNEARNDDISIKRIKTQGIKRFNSNGSDFFTVSCEYIYIYINIRIYIL